MELIITTHEDLKRTVSEAVNAAIAGLNLRKEDQTANIVHGLSGLAELLGCSEMTAFRLKNSGRIPYYQQGRTLVFKSDEVLTAMAKGKKK